MTKDTFYSVVHLNWFLRVICLSNIYRNGNHLAESRSIAKSTIYVISFGILNSYCLYHKVINNKAKRQTGVVTFSGSVQLTYWLPYIEYIIGVYIVNKKRKVPLIKYFKSYDYIDTILGNACYCDIRKTVLYNAVVASGIYFINSLFDHIAWTMVEGWKVAKIYSVDYLYFFLNMFTVLDIVSHVIQVEYRLKMIGDLLQDFNTKKYSHKIGNMDINSHETLSCQENKKNKTITSIKNLYTGKHSEIIWFSRCYLLLVGQAEYLNSSYGFRVLVYCVNLLINMINNLNLSIRLVNGTLHLVNPYGPLTLLPCMSSTMRALNYSLLVIILLYRCEQTYAQSDRILETIDKLLIEEDTFCKVLKSHLQEFRNLIITRPIKFHASKFFTMDYSLLVSLSSVVVTYTIIILQSMQDN